MVELSIITLYFVLIALLGGIAFVFFESRSWQDLRKYKNARHLVLAGIAGFVWFLLHSEWGFPNAVVCFIAGWFAPSFLEGFVKRVKRVRSDS